MSFELVESIFLDESDDLVGWNIDQIKELGIDIEIDDFGTGYASIVSLLKLKPRRLKIDRQLVMPIVESAGAAAARRLDHRYRQVARHRGRRRGRRDDGACAHPQGPRLRHPAGLRLRRPMSAADLKQFRPFAARSSSLPEAARPKICDLLQPFGLVFGFRGSDRMTAGTGSWFERRKDALERPSAE